jgi:hypothetical protein
MVFDVFTQYNLKQIVSLHGSALKKGYKETFYCTFKAHPPFFLLFCIMKAHYLDPPSCL